MSESFIDPEIEKIGLEMSANAGESVRKIMRDNGMTEKEIDDTMRKVTDAISINGVPLRAVGCLACNGRGWVLPDEKD